MDNSCCLYSPIPFIVGFDSPFHLKCPFHWVGRFIFQHIKLVVIKFPIVSCKIDIPFIVDAM